MVAVSPKPKVIFFLLLEPFFKDVLINLTIYGFAIFGAFVVVGAANSVNLTDGLDGLAIVPVMVAGGTFALIAYICGTPRYADYLYLINTPGTIDSDYRGEVGVLMINLGDEPVAIAHGDRIAQAVIAPVQHATFTQVDALDDSARGAGGFGSTGVR